MCRLIAIPPGFSRNEALRILLDMEALKNRDGVGSAYVGKDGEFHIVKYDKSLTHVLRRKKPFLTHLPHNGWTIVHMRAASHGSISVVNTHPFEVGDWCVCHNGVWSNYSIASLLMEHLAKIKMKGQTDSEVAANLLNLVGPERFTWELDYSGVFLGLKKDGSLHVMKTSGDLEVLERGKQVVISSEFDYQSYKKENPYTLMTGYYCFNASGKAVKREPMKWKMPKKERSIFVGREAIIDTDFDEDARLFDSEFSESFIRHGDEQPFRAEPLAPMSTLKGAEKEPTTKEGVIEQSEREKMDQEAAYQKFLAQAMEIKRGAVARGIIQGPNVESADLPSNHFIDPANNLTNPPFAEGNAVDMTKYLMKGRKRGCRRGPPKSDPVLAAITDSPSF